MLPLARACVYICVCMCVYVCVCVCVCVISTAKTDGPMLMKLSTNHRLLYLQSLFYLRCWIYIFDSDVMTAILYVFGCGNLTVVIFTNFLQFLRRKCGTFSGVCYLKLANLVDNFGCQADRIFEKKLKSEMVAKYIFFKSGKLGIAFHLFLTRTQRIWQYFVDWMSISIDQLTYLLTSPWAIFLFLCLQP